MTRIIRTIILAVIVAIISLSAALSQSIPVKLVRAKGTVEVKNSKSKGFVGIKPVLVLNAGDVIRTLANAKAQITFPNETVLLLGQKSLLKLNFLDNSGAGKINVKNGNFLVDLKKALQEGSTFEIRTRDALAVVRGTIVEGNIDDKTTKFRGYKGKVSVYSNKKPDEPPLELLPGMLIEIDSNGNLVSSKNDKSLEQAMIEYQIEGSEEEKEEEERDSLALAPDTEEVDAKESTSPDEDPTAKQRGSADKITTGPESVEGLEVSQKEAFSETFLLAIYKDLLKARDSFDKALDRNDNATALNIFLSLKSKFDQVEKYKLSIDYSPQTNKSKLLTSIIELINYFKFKAQLLVSNPDKALEQSPGSINNLDNDLYGPNTGKDTDQDGIDDGTEVLINTNPNISNRDSGFFVTQVPRTNAQLHLAVDNPIQFRAQPLITTQPVQYELVVLDANKKPIVTQRQDLPNFVWDATNDLIDNRNEIEWYVNAYLPTKPDFNFPIPSQKSRLIVWKELGPTMPPQQGNILLEGTMGGTNPTNGEIEYTIDVNYMNFVSIKSAQMNIEFDPTMLEFQRAMGIGHFANALVFAGGAENTGKLTISAEKPANLNYTVANTGSLFRLTFRIIGKGASPISVKNAAIAGANDEVVNPQTESENLIVN